MTMNNQLDGSTLTIAVEGRVDTQTAPELEENVKGAIEGATDLILDFTQVGYISSAGLRVVLAAQNWMNAKNGSMVIRGAAKNILNIFKVTGFDTFLNLE